MNENQTQIYSININTAYLKTMKKNECIIYSLIVGFSASGKPFFFTNKTLQEALNICKKTVINSINRLEEKKLITVKYFGNKRYIYLAPSDTMKLFKKVLKNGTIHNDKC